MSASNVKQHLYPTHHVENQCRGEGTEDIAEI